MRAVAIAALVALPFATTQAAGPFQVRRAASGQEVCTSAPVATVATSPYDGELSAMFDPASHYYAVYDAAGSPLQIAVQRNPVTQSLRISFDDGNGQSAPVSATSSSVAVAPSTINADGLQAAVITIVPRDVNGVMLGTGLSMSIDASFLWPAQLTGPVSDLGDGSYRAVAVAPVVGTGTVRVVVEGVDLAPLPTITAVAMDPSASLRDLAIAQLQSLIGPTGPLGALSTGTTAGTPQSAAVASALERANAALATLANGDPMRDDNVLKTDFDAILSDLESVLAEPGSLDALAVRDAMDDLVGVARLIAEWHVDRASETCGVCQGHEPAKVCSAAAALDLGDTMRGVVSPDWSGVVDAYARATEWALQAVQIC